LFVALTGASSNVDAQAVDCSGTNPSAGSSTSVSTLGNARAFGIYRISATTALALYQDNSGSGGTPFSIRGVVLTLSGTTITVGTSAGINDIITDMGGGVYLNTCQLSATSYVVAYYESGPQLSRAVSVTVSGTTTTFGTPLTIESGALAEFYTSMFGGSRFNPNLYPLSGTTALLTYGMPSGNEPVRHVILTNSGGTLTAGQIFYSAWLASNSGANLPQFSDGFLFARNNASAANRAAVDAMTISGTTLSITGSVSGFGVPQVGSANVFGLSGGVRGVNYYTTALGGATSRNGQIALFRFSAGSPPRFLGVFTIPNTQWTSGPFLEVSPSRGAFLDFSIGQGASATSLLKLNILEFIA
jgi:hypothetical protein